MIDSRVRHTVCVARGSSLALEPMRGATARNLANVSAKSELPDTSYQLPSVAITLLMIRLFLWGGELSGGNAGGNQRLGVSSADRLPQRRMAMHRLFRGALTLALLVSLAEVAVSQHQHNQASGYNSSTARDTRQFVRFPAELVEHTLANMRDHLLALQEIQEQLARGHADQAARIAESRLGMSSLGLHGAQEAAKYMPQGMQDTGTAMHRSASKFVIASQDADVTGDLKPAVAALAEITAQCNGCHAGYRIR